MHVGHYEDWFAIPRRALYNNLLNAHLMLQCAIIIHIISDSRIIVSSPWSREVWTCPVDADEILSEALSEAKHRFQQKH